MTLGRSIRIYLDQGEVSGIRHAELVNWTGQALLCPRSRIGELADWESIAKRPGVYFLLGAEHLASPEVYIGESESVLDRLRQHVGEEFWHEMLFFTSKDENLTKSHVKYLESRLVNLAKAAKRYVVKNGNQPTRSGLPRADRDAMEEFLLNIPLLLGALGHRVLDPLAVWSVAPSPAAPVVLTFSVKEATASGTVTDDGFVVFAGGTALTQILDSLGAGTAALKQELIASGKLVLKGDLYEFAQDVLFTSPSAAASVVCGTAANGRVGWKAPDGRTLKEIEEAEVAAGAQAHEFVAP